MTTYKDMQSSLEIIITELQSNQLDVDEAIKKYNEASKLILKMEKYLKTADNKIKIIKINLKEN